MDLRYNYGNHDYQDAQDATAIFQALAMMTDEQKHIPSDFAKKISRKILERSL